MKIYTKTGDTGETSLFGGKRVKKHNSRIEAYGTLDELISHLGLIADLSNKETKASIIRIQNTLFNISSHIATSKDNESLLKRLPEISETDITEMEKEIDSMENGLPELKNFILPGGHPLVSHCHIARTVCRRAERRISELNETEKVEEVIIKYINRLSDFMFVLARHIAKINHIQEVLWNQKK